jgi:hypothetical protein
MMLGSNILDIAIGLVFVFLLLSLICSAANELIEQIMKARGRNLEQGILEMMGDPQSAAAFVSDLYSHGLINSLYRGKYVAGSKKLPSYIPAANFALALQAVKAVWDVKPPENHSIPANVVSAMKSFEELAAGDARKLQKEVETWYNSAMDRVTGWYKRRTQFIILVLAFVVTIGANADCIAIAQSLSRDASLRQGLVAAAESAAKNDQTSEKKPLDTIKEELTQLNALSLPIGWPEPQDHRNVWDRMRYAVGQHGFGWLLTAVAISLGSPFWFDVLSKFMAVRSTIKPQDKGTDGKTKS